MCTCSEQRFLNSPLLRAKLSAAKLPLMTFYNYQVCKLWPNKPQARAKIWIHVGLRSAHQKAIDTVTAATTREERTNIHMSLLTWNACTVRPSSEVLMRPDEKIDCV